jgi:hypothetical protein
VWRVTPTLRILDVSNQVILYRGVSEGIGSESLTESTSQKLTGYSDTPIKVSDEYRVQITPASVSDVSDTGYIGV